MVTLIDKVLARKCSNENVSKVFDCPLFIKYILDIILACQFHGTNYYLFS